MRKENGMRKVLVTGANGQLGRAICRQFEQSLDFELIGMSNKEFDITDYESLEAVFESTLPDWVINCAAYTNVDAAEISFDEAMEVNVVAVGYLALICKDYDIPIIHFSSDYVYHNNLDTPLKETDPTSPKSVYAISKLESEEVLRENWNKHLILRTSWLYSHEGHNFVNTMLRLGEKQEELEIVSDQIGAPTFVEDISEAIPIMIKTIDLKYQDTVDLWGTYNISNSGQTNWCEFAKTLFQFTGLEVNCRSITTKEFNAPAPRPAYSVLSNAKMKAAFGIELRNWKVALKNCLKKAGKLKE